MNVLVERPSPAIKTGDLCPDDSENCRLHPLWRYARLAPPENPLRAHPTARERPDSGDSDSKRRAILGIPAESSMTGEHSDAIRSFIARFANPPRQQIENFLESGIARVLKRGEYFVDAGKRSEELAFVHAGMLRYHLTTIDGRDVTKDFSMPNSFCVAFTSAVTKQPSQINISALLPCDLSIWPFARLEEMFAMDLQWQQLGRRVAEGMYIRKERREVSFLLESAQDRYLSLQREFGSLLGDVPQYHIASYLGIAPESLSRLRRRVNPDQ